MDGGADPTVHALEGLGLDAVWDSVGDLCGDKTPEGIRHVD